MRVGSLALNGGIETLIQCREHLKRCDGVMLGRAAYHNPSLLREVDQQLYGVGANPVSYGDVIDQMCDYAQGHIDRGGRLNQITRHMIGLFQGIPGARQWRQILSTQSVKPGAGPQVLRDAYGAVSSRFESAA